MIQTLHPERIAPPMGPYSHGIVCSGPGRWLHIAGQIGVTAEGVLQDGFEAQARQAWDNLCAVLQAAGMDVSHLVKVTSFVVDATHLPLLGPVRSGFLGAARPASTLLVVQALAKPGWLYEVEATAFRPDTE
ncbi:MAG: RidA family protein [Proteobacteria bacterium]|nr:RidA family protein [Pseudomonadota bacterium]